MKAETSQIFAPRFGHDLNDAKRVVILSDIQIPFQDQPVLELVYRFIDLWQPDTLIINGDLVDFYSLSQFDKDPLKVDRVVEEVTGVANFFERTKIVQNRIWLGGNHEDRWRKTLWKMQQFGPGAKAVLQALVNAAEATEDADAAFRFIFSTKKMDVTYWPYGHYMILAHNNLVVTHGFRLSQHSAYSAKMHIERLGRSVIVGHTHRQGVYRNSNLRGTHGAWENGCLCRLDPDYVQFPNWQQGFSIVTIEQEQFYVEQVPILPGPSIKYSDWETIRAAGIDQENQTVQT